MMRAGFINFLPIKKRFLQEFSESKIPALQETHSYLEKSIKGDEVQIATQFQSGLSRGYFRRIISEIAIKEQLTKTLLTAVEESNKNKEALKKAEEEKKQAEGNEGESRESAKQ